MKYINFDAVIIGGGIVGLTLACALASKNIKVALIEKSNMELRYNAKPDGRASAISYGSKQILQAFNLWHHLESEAGLIEEIRVSDNKSKLFLHFDHELVSGQPLGFMLENNTLIHKLYESAKNYENLIMYSECHYNLIEEKNDKVFITLENKAILSADILIAADGKNSAVRKLTNIEVVSKNYDQTAIVCSVSHELNHHNIAQERFLPSGPFAILPLRGGFHSAIVWTEKKDRVPVLMSMVDEEFLYFLRQRFTDYLGEIKIHKPRFAYPLSFSYAKKYYSHNIVLVGDAAHAIHPIAGQGVNMGFRDIEILVKLMVQYKKLGFALNNSQLLAEYERTRQADNQAMLLITHGLNALFSNDYLPVKVMRRLGLAAVNKIPLLQKYFMNYARGVY
ncbi:2-octaprenyl-6-methoxyphenol hydroxylase [Rickettsiales bacterium Ac37b]|nr:2-octaprenyl-6-methoxyphenol hydroxylase [Rickettsiales bacterium Ac37b]